jgi:hypothetical protein
MAKPSRWNGEKRYQIVKEALSQKEPIAGRWTAAALSLRPLIVHSMEYPR